MEMLVEIAPLNAGTGTRVTLRLASAMDKRIVALNGQRWWPAIKRKASLSHQFFDGDFTGEIGTGGASFQISMFALKRLDGNAAGYRFAKAAVTIYAAEPGTAWPWPVAFRGVVDRFANADETLQLDCIVDTTPFDVSALTLTYAGTGGIEGPADLRNKVKPWCFGRARGVEPVLIDAANGVYQVSAYGPINGVTALYERASSFGASVGNFADYAALVAASIPAGRWGTCLALGLIRLGAPAAGIITADVEGDRPSGIYLRRTGAIISRLCSNAGVAGGNINAASLAALDTWAATLPSGGNVNVYLTEQIKLIDLIRRLARPCNAMAGISWTGELFVSRFGTIGTPAVTLDAQGRFLPPVKECSEEPVSPPYTRIEAGADRCWRTHATNEIAFFADLVERGDYAGGTSYREGNIAVSQGARWLYINPTATTGNAPPTLPTTSNSFWELLQAPPAYSTLSGAPTSLAGINAGEGSKLTGIEPGANVTETRTSADTARVNGVLAASLTAQAATAASNASSALTQLAAIVSDSILDRSEKPRVVRDFNAITAEYASINGQAVALGLTSSSEKAAWDAAADALGFYLGGLSPGYADTSADTTIVAATFQSKFNDYYQTRTVLLNRMAAEAALRASWPSVTGTGKPADNADVTASVLPAMLLPAAPVIKADYTGAALPGQLNRVVKAARTRGGSDVSSTTTWSIATFGCTASISTDGTITITACAATGRIVVTSTRDSFTIVDEFAVVKELGAPPATGGAGATSASDSSIASISSASYSGEQAGPLTVTAGSGGTVTLSAPLSFSSAATVSTRGKWQWRIVGGSYADVAAEINSSTAAIANEPDSGYIEVSQTRTGLTPGTAYEFVLQLRRASGSGTVDFSGTASAVAS